MGKKFQNILPNITPKIKLKNYSSSRFLDKVASSLQTSLTLAVNLSAPPRKPPPRKVKPDWWDENIEELRRTSRRFFNNARTTKLDSSWKDYKVSLQSYKKERRPAKRRNGRNGSESIVPQRLLDYGNCSPSVHNHPVN